MRKVVLNISKLGLSIGNVIKIQLVDSVGKNTMSTFGYSFDATIAISADTEEIELLENDFIPHQSNYKIILPNTLEFTFRVPRLDGANTPHDLTSLLSIGCAHRIIDLHERKLDDDFVYKLNLYFISENPHFTPSQKDIVRLYEYYADEVKQTTYTIDIIQMMDEYLSTLKGENNAQ